MPRASLLLLLLLATPLAAEPALDGALVARPFTSGEPVNDLVLAEDGALVVGACDGVAALWEAASGRRLGELPARGFYDALALVDGVLVTAEGLPPRLRAWDLSRRELLAELLLDPAYEPRGVLGTGFPPEPQVVLAPAPDHALLAVAWKDQVRLLRPGDLSVVRALQTPPPPADEHDDPAWSYLHALGWSEDGRALHGWDAQRTHGWSWDVAQAPLPVSLPPATLERRGDEWVTARALLRGGDALELRGRRDERCQFHYRLVRVDEPGDVCWSAPLSYRDVGARPTLLALEASGRVLLTRRDGSPLAFSLADGRRFDGYGPRSLRRLFAGPGEQLILWDDGNGLWLWDSGHGGDPHRLATPLPSGEGAGELAVLLDVDPGLRYAAAELEDGRVLLWELHSGQLLRAWRDGDRPNLNGLAVRAPGGAPRCFYNAYHGEGRQITAGGRTVVDYSRGVDLVARDASGQTLFRRAPNRGTRFQVGPRGRLLLAADDRLLLDLATGLEREIPHDRRFVSGRAISPDGRRVAVAGLRDREQLLTVYELGDGRGVREQVREALVGVTQDVAFSPDGARVVAVDNQGALVLDLRAGTRTRLELTAAAAASFLPDARLAIGARDGSVTVWDLDAE